MNVSLTGICVCVLIFSDRERSTMAGPGARSPAGVREGDDVPGTRALRPVNSAASASSAERAVSPGSDAGSESGQFREICGFPRPRWRDRIETATRDERRQPGGAPHRDADRVVLRGPRLRDHAGLSRFRARPGQEGSPACEDGCRPEGDGQGGHAEARRARQGAREARRAGQGEGGGPQATEPPLPPIPKEVQDKIDAARRAVAEAIVAAQDAGLVETSIDPPPILDILITGRATDAPAEEPLGEEAVRRQPRGLRRVVHRLQCAGVREYRLRQGRADRPPQRGAQGVFRSAGGDAEEPDRRGAQGQGAAAGRQAGREAKPAEKKEAPKPAEKKEAPKPAETKKAAEPKK